jgi:hypothetical protein
VAFACKLAHDYGVRFYPEVIGLSRMGTHQTSHVKTEKETRRLGLLPLQTGGTHLLVGSRYLSN